MAKNFNHFPNTLVVGFPSHSNT